MFDIILEQVTEKYKDLQDEERAQRIVAEITEEIRKAKNELTLNFQSILSNPLDLRTMEKLFGKFLGVIKNLEDYHVSRTNELLIETEVSVNSILGQLEVIFESVNVHSKLAAYCFALYAMCSIIRAAILNERIRT